MRKLKVDLSRYHRWFIRWSERNITEEDCLNGEIENLYVMLSDWLDLMAIPIDRKLIGQEIVFPVNAEHQDKITYDTFLEMLKEKGYKIKQGKYMAVLMPGMKKYIRLDKIGDEYTRENIIKRIINESIADYKSDKVNCEPKIINCRFKRYRRAKLTGIQKKYFAKLYRTGKLKKRAYSQAWK